MAKKADRAKNIRKLTAEDCNRLEPTGCWVDESLPPALLKAMQDFSGELDIADFDGFMRERLGMYRMTIETSDQRLPIAYQRKITEETSEIIQELLIRLDRLPNTIEISAWVDACKVKLDVSPTRVASGKWKEAPTMMAA